MLCSLTFFFCMLQLISHSEVYVEATDISVTTKLLRYPFRLPSYFILPEHHKEQAVNTQKCAEGHKWDPFFKKCRKLSCSLSGYKIINGKCVGQREEQAANIQKCSGGFKWDPIFKKCRELTCSQPGYKFVNGKCVERREEQVFNIQKCSGGQKWDPYFKKCRKLVCSLPGYKAINGKCVKD